MDARNHSILKLGQRQGNNIATIALSLSA